LRTSASQAMLALEKLRVMTACLRANGGQILSY
jgi:hypothetical protein